MSLGDVGIDVYHQGSRIEAHINGDIAQKILHKDWEIAQSDKCWPWKRGDLSVNGRVNVKSVKCGGHALVIPVL